MSVGAALAVADVAWGEEGRYVDWGAGYKDMEAVASVEEGHNADIGIQLLAEDHIVQCGVAAVVFARLVLRWGLSLCKSFHRNDEVQ